MTSSNKPSNGRHQRDFKEWLDDELERSRRSDDLGQLMQKHRINNHGKTPTKPDKDLRLVLAILGIYLFLCWMFSP
jgi:hypothetical protein